MKIGGKMKIYLAARYSKMLMLREFAQKLEALGHRVTSRWLNEDHKMTFERCSDEERANVAGRDEADILDSDCIIGFTELRDTPTSGGRHVEWGMARAMGLVQICIGPKENVFYYLDEVVHCETQEDCLKILTKLEGE